MTKYVLLKSRVPSTFDAGFRSCGYEVVQIAEVDAPVELGKNPLDAILKKKKKKKSAKLMENEQMEGTSE